MFIPLSMRLESAKKVPDALAAHGLDLLSRLYGQHQVWSIVASVSGSSEVFAPLA